MLKGKMIVVTNTNKISIYCAFKTISKMKYDFKLNNSNRQYKGRKIG
jgi:hypothetical protein